PPRPYIAPCFPAAGAGDHRGLHSFPTRRSSDLRMTSSGRWAREAASAVRGSAAGLAPGSSERLSAAGPGYSRIGAYVGSCSRVRSEEHTSELQSRENLVCRLLLEKKKYG